MTHRAFKQEVRARMARTGEPYAQAHRILTEIQGAPAPDNYEETWGEAYYTSESYDHSPYGPTGITITYVDEEADESETLASAADSSPQALSWFSVEEKAAVATLILIHRLGQQPSIEQVDEFVKLIAGGWADDHFTVFVGQISDQLGV
jgi:hypothetical protein